VLPVSLTVVPPDDDDEGDDDVDVVGVDELELPQAARNASGTTAAAVATKRILFPTGEISFAPRTRVVRCSSGTRDACGKGPHWRADLAVPAGVLLISARSGSPAQPKRPVT
jgi:hypothetical protein